MSVSFYSNFKWEGSLDAKLNSASNEYPHCILLTDSSTPKTRNTWKTWWWDQHHIFSGTLLPQKQEILEKNDDDVIIRFFQVYVIITFFSIISCFWGNRVSQKYELWVLVGCRIEFCIQWVPPLEIWVKSQGDKLKMRKQKVGF